MRKRRFLVTGGSGMIGSRICSYLRTLGHTVFPVVHRSAIPMSGSVRMDLLEANDAQLHDLMHDTRPTHLIHAAWYVGHNHLYARENILWCKMTRRLANAFESAGGHRFIGVGTSREYAIDAASPIAETARTASETTYGQMKRLACIEAENVFANGDVTFGWARLFNTFSHDEPYDRFMSSVARTIYAGGVPVIRKPFAMHDYMHANDAAFAIVEFALSDVNGIVNIGSGIGFSLWELAKYIERAMGGKIEMGPNETNQPTIVADVNRLRNEVRYELPYTVLRGIDEFVKKIREQNEGH